MSELLGKQVRVLSGPCANFVGVVTGIKKSPTAQRDTITAEFRNRL